MKTAAKGAKYKRISDDREGRELGVARQDEDLDALARQHGITVAADHDYTDNDVGASAQSRKPRPAYERMVADARAGRFDVILAYTSSRLTRRPREHEDLIDLATQHGITYRFVRSPSFDLNTAAGRHVARTLAAQDAATAEQTAELVARAVRQRAAQQDPHGGPRGYGITADGRGLVDVEADEIRRWYQHVLAGGTLLGIRRDLERRNVPSVSGAPWRAPVIRRILLNPRNAGLRILEDGSEHPAPHPAVVPRATWQAACAILRDPGRGGMQSPARKHLGTGLYLCERCTPRTVNFTPAKDGGRLYKCLQCWRTWRADPLDRWIVEELVAGILDKEDARKRLLPKPRKDIDVDALTVEQAAIRQNMQTAAADFMLAKGATRAALQAGLDAGERRLAEIDATLGDVGRADPLAAVLLAEDPVAAWLGLTDLGQRQAIIRALMTVTLGPPIRGRATWDPRKFIDVEPRR